MTIFDEYAKLALQQGLISTAAEEEPVRYGKDSLKYIENLQNIQPDGQEKTIVEQAHPETYYAAKAHDRMNGVVENVQERQNVMVEIARRAPTGNLFNHRYVQAHQDLMSSLSKASWWLDREGEYEMMTLSDSCLKKTAGLPLILGLVALVGVLGGVAYKMNHPSSHGFAMDLTLAKQKIDDSIGDYPELRKTLQPLIDNLDKLQQSFTSAENDRADVKARLMALSGAQSIEEKKKILQANSINFFASRRYDKIMASLADLRAKGDAVLRQIPGAIEELKGARGKYEKTLSIPGLNDLWESAKTLWYNYGIQSDTDGAVDALDILSSSINDLFTGINNQVSELENLKSQVQNIPEGDILQELKNDVTPGPSTAQKEKPHSMVSAPIES